MDGENTTCYLNYIVFITIYILFNFDKHFKTISIFARITCYYYYYFFFERPYRLI
jgi:hypothetical protein